MRRVTFVLATSVAACGGLLPFTGDDEEPPAPPPTSASADAADDTAADSADGGTNSEAAVGQDGGLFCFQGGICADDESECCSGKGVDQAGCIQKCEILCCLP